MLGIKRSTMNRDHINTLSTHRLATHVIVQGTIRQKKTLYYLLTQVALIQISSIGRLIPFTRVIPINVSDIFVRSVMNVFQMSTNATLVIPGKIRIQLVSSSHTTNQEESQNNITLQQSAFLQKYFSYGISTQCNDCRTFVETAVRHLGDRISSSTVVYAAYLLERVAAMKLFAIPCAHCKGDVVMDMKCKTCCSIRNNIRYGVYKAFLSCSKLF